MVKTRSARFASFRAVAAGKVLVLALAMTGAGAPAGAQALPAPGDSMTDVAGMEFVSRTRKRSLPGVWIPSTRMFAWRVGARREGRQAFTSCSIYRSAARVRNPDRVSPWRAAASSTMANTRAGTVMLIRRALLESRERSTVTSAQSPSW